MKKNTAPMVAEPLAAEPLVVTRPAEPVTMPTTGSVTETMVIAQTTPHYVLRLYVTGATTRSARAISNIRKICEEHLEGHYDLEVVDISQHPTLAEGEQIIAAPTLIKKLPLPLRRFIGDMSHTERILVGLDLRDTVAKPSFSGVV